MRLILTVAICVALTPISAKAVPQSQEPSPWLYEVSVQPKAHELNIVVAFNNERQLIVTVNESFAQYVQNLRLTGEKPEPIKTQKDLGNTWIIAPCPAKSCKVEYTFALADAAKNNSYLVQETQGVFLTWPEAWLIRPRVVPPTQKAQVHFVTQPDALAATGFAEKLGSNAYAIPADAFESPPITVFGPLHIHEMKVAESRIDVALVPSQYKMSEEQIFQWAQRAGTAIQAYYGKFPVSHALLVIPPHEENSRGGVSYGSGGAVSMVPLERDATEEKMRDDWVMTHEMVHLAFPTMERSHHWIEEGIATYVEPIARIRSHELKAENVFRDMIFGMPKGLPKNGDHGLDVTHSWGRTYWGGALFCLLADVEIRKQTHGKLGLEHALRGIIDAGGSTAVDWDIVRTLRAADEATKLHVLEDLYNKMKDKPYSPDITKLWHDLGVVYDSQTKTVHFDDLAPLAYVRQGIVTGQALAPLK